VSERVPANKKRQRQPDARAAPHLEVSPLVHSCWRERVQKVACVDAPGAHRQPTYFEGRALF
jgi:hypothetical protein